MCLTTVAGGVLVTQLIYPQRNQRRNHAGSREKGSLGERLTMNTMAFLPEAEAGPIQDASNSSSGSPAKSVCSV